MALTQNDRDALVALLLKIDNVEDARYVFNGARGRLLDLKNIAAQQDRRQFRVGDKVWFNANTRGIIHGTVTKIMPKNIGVKADNGQSWKVFPSLLNHA